MLAPPLVRFGETLLSQGRDPVDDRTLPATDGNAGRRI
jgi:hypothetical protein